MTASPLINVTGVAKTYANGFEALKGVDLEVREGEILALLGPNGAGKTTLIGIICGLVNATAGTVTVDGRDIVADYRKTRALIGLVPQEIATDAFESVRATVAFSRGLFGKAPDPAHIERVLRDLSLWDKRDSQIMALSGGMKRRVMIAKALAHEPRILFLDEPTAGVDVELRKGMWQLVRQLRDSGVTVVLTTHYIQEAEEMADRVGIINKGELVLVEEKKTLMHQLGRKHLRFELVERMDRIPDSLADYGLTLDAGGMTLVYTYDVLRERTGINSLIAALGAAGIAFRDLATAESSLEEIFVNLVREEA